jgi:putative membrane protein
MPIKEMFQGFCMALADSVPGVSGGSIAFIMGFYEKFIGSLNGIFSRDRNERREGFKFLIKLQTVDKRGSEKILRASFDLISSCNL